MAKTALNYPPPPIEIDSMTSLTPKKAKLDYNEKQEVQLNTICMIQTPAFIIGL